jgi:hypothetical protein
MPEADFRPLIEKVALHIQVLAWTYLAKAADRHISYVAHMDISLRLSWLLLPLDRCNFKKCQNVRAVPKLNSTREISHSGSEKSSFL